MYSYGYDIETKAQPSQWKRLEELKPKKACQVRSYVKVLVTVFLDCNCLVHHEFLLDGRIVNKEYYLAVRSRLCKAICQKRAELLKNHSWNLLIDNIPAHVLMSVLEFSPKTKP